MSKNTKAVNYQARRQKFLKSLKGGVAVLPAAGKIIRNHDVTFPHRQDSSFFYLTGFDEPNGIALFAPHSEAPFQMFVASKDKTKEMWEGLIRGPAVAKKQYGADAAFASEDPTFFDNSFVEAMVGAERLYYRVGLSAQMDQRIFKLLQIAKRKLGRTGRPLWPILDPSDILGELRAVKDSAEIERMEKAAHISALAHLAAMKNTKPGQYEYELEAQLFRDFRAGGAQRLGYESIVASGANACVLHYTDNNRQIKKNDLVLIDAGAEYDYYTADITRTYPAGGKYTPEQAEIYKAVLKSQVACVKMVAPGKTMKDLHHQAASVLVEELLKLKILKGQKKQILKDKSYQDFFPHGIGHYLGMDVHDIGKYYAKDYEDPRPLEPGMIITVEPGLYFQKYSNAPSKYKGIGVRIEDDVLVTKSGHKVLTSEVPKELEEVEAACNA